MARAHRSRASPKLIDRLAFWPAAGADRGPANSPETQLCASQVRKRRTIRPLVNVANDNKKKNKKKRQRAGYIMGAATRGLACSGAPAPSRGASRCEERTCGGPGEKCARDTSNATAAPRAQMIMLGHLLERDARPTSALRRSPSSRALISVATGAGTREATSRTVTGSALRGCRLDEWWGRGDGPPRSSGARRTSRGLHRARASCADASPRAAALPGRRYSARSCLQRAENEFALSEADMLNCQKLRVPPEARLPGVMCAACGRCNRGFHFFVVVVT